jgi:DNA-binding MarR family transcriptional regulator
MTPAGFVSVCALLPCGLRALACCFRLHTEAVISCHDMISLEAYRALAELRHQVRRLLAFSEEQARTAGLEPQQHQLLLAVKGLPAGEAPTIRSIAARLLLRHHSVVELVDRLEARSLIERETDTHDRRAIRLRITAKGERTLKKLSEAHAAELQTLGPALVAAVGLVMQPPPPPPAPLRRRRRGGRAK